MIQKREEMKDNRGFSLVELIIVIAIMAILVAVLAPQFLKYVERSRNSADVNNAKEITNAISAYAADTTASEIIDGTYTIKVTEDGCEITTSATNATAVATAMCEAGLRPWDVAPTSTNPGKGKNDNDTTMKCRSKQNFQAYKIVVKAESGVVTFTYDAYKEKACTNAADSKYFKDNFQQ